MDIVVWCSAIEGWILCNFDAVHTPGNVFCESLIRDYSYYVPSCLIYIHTCIQYFRYAVFNEDGTLAELKVSHMISGVCGVLIFYVCTYAVFRGLR